MMSYMCKRWGSSLVLAASTFGCGGELDGEGVSAGIDDGEIETPSVDMVSEALGATERCEGGTADQTVWGGENSWSTTNSYGRKSCIGGYLVDLNDYVNIVSAPTAPSWSASVRCDAGLPPTEHECEKLEVVTYVWKRIGKQRPYVGTSSAFAVWNGNNCMHAMVLVNSFAVTEGDDLRIAAACRKHDFPNAPESPYSLQPLRFDL